MPAVDCIPLSQRIAAYFQAFYLISKPLLIEISRADAPA